MLSRSLEEVAVGDTVIRMLAGVMPMQLGVTEVTDDKIICGPWEFDRSSGQEIDELISGPISYLIVPPMGDESDDHESEE